MLLTQQILLKIVRLESDVASRFLSRVDRLPAVVAWVIFSCTHIRIQV